MVSGTHLILIERTGEFDDRLHSMVADRGAQQAVIRAGADHDEAKIPPPVSQCGAGVNQNALPLCWSQTADTQYGEGLAGAVRLLLIVMFDVHAERTDLEFVPLYGRC